MSQLVTDLTFIIAVSAPLIFATMGALLGERAGVINLSLDGAILLAAMTGFAVGLRSESVGLGFLAAALVGALVALVLCVVSLSLGQSQTAVGFVLALLCTDLSSFLGAPYVRVPGVAVPPPVAIPGLAAIPVLGPIFFNQSLTTYASLLLVPALWWLLYRTRAGLTLRALGERPAAAFARGVNVTQMRYLYVLLGGALVGLAGAAYSLDVQRGWSYRHTFGTGWIALAIVIFGGWSPWRVAVGCYLFGALQAYAIRSQALLPNLPTQIFQVAPFALMIFVLALVNGTSNPAVVRWVGGLPAGLRRPIQWTLARIAAPAPAALGRALSEER